MAGRIRTIKPEWLEDEKIAFASSDARVLSVALLLLADDHGRGRGHAGWVAAQVFPGQDKTVASVALGELEAAGFIYLYTVRQQTYFEIVNWQRHQRVDKPGRPRVPAPDALPVAEAESAKVVYFIRGQRTRLIKIGQSIDPVQRLAELSRCSAEDLELLAVFESETEAQIHSEFSDERVHGEWFRESSRIFAKLRERGFDEQKPIATAGNSFSVRQLTPPEIPKTAPPEDAEITQFANIRDNLANVREDLATDPDPDHDHDLTHTSTSSTSECAPKTSSAVRHTRAAATSTELATVGVVLEKLARWSGVEYRASSAGHRNAIVQRLRAGHDEHDLRLVVWCKGQQWQGDERMAKYLRPSTLFGAKFDEYLDEARALEMQRRAERDAGNGDVPDGPPLQLFGGPA